MLSGLYKFFITDYSNIAASFVKDLRTQWTQIAEYLETNEVRQRIYYKRYAKQRITSIVGEKKTKSYIRKRCTSGRKKNQILI